VCDPDFHCAVDAAGNETVVRLGGELDLAASHTVQRALAHLDGRVVVDLSDLRFLDSTGIRAFVIAHQRLVEQGGAFVVRSPQAQVRRVLEIAGMDRWLEAEP
jgi:anti-anti-sigma factor